MKTKEFIRYKFKVPEAGLYRITSIITIGSKVQVLEDVMYFKTLKDANEFLKGIKVDTLMLRDA